MSAGFTVGQKVEVKVTGRVMARSAEAPHDYIVVLDDVPDMTVYRFEVGLASAPVDDAGAGI